MPRKDQFYDVPESLLKAFDEPGYAWRHEAEAGNGLVYLFRNRGFEFSRSYLIDGNPEVKHRPS